MLGSAASIPRRPGGPGVPSVSAMVGLVEARLGEQLPSGCSYQQAFEHLVRSQGLDSANEVIRDAVLRARIFPAETAVDLETLEDEAKGWWVPDGLHALATLVAHHPEAFGRTVLTTNFDPLIEVALARAHVPWYSTSLHADGSLLYLRGTGTHVVHLHGHWWGSDTLHTPTQLQAHRPQLRASLRALLRERTLVVVAYGGWDDAFMSAIANVSEENDARPDILWAFYPDDTTRIEREHGHVVQALGHLSSRQRCTFYSGVDFDTLLLSALTKTVEVRPAQSAEIFFERVALLRNGAVSLPSDHRLGWHSTDSLGEFVKALRHFGDELPARAALCLAQYLLPLLEGQPIHAAPQPLRFDWVRPVIQRAMSLVDAPTSSAGSDSRQDLVRLTVASATLQKDSFDWFALEACADALCSALAFATDGTCTRDGGPNWASTSVDWAAASVHVATRALHDDERAAWGYITSRLSEGRDHLARFRS